MSTPTVAALDPSRWPAYADLIERHHGIWSGCWCVGFHDGPGRFQSADGNRALKERLVREGRTHAAIVLEGDLCVGWCQYGSAAELPNITSKKAYPETVEGRRTSGSFLFNGTVEMFEKAGFTRERQIAMHRWAMVRDVPSA